MKSFIVLCGRDEEARSIRACFPPPDRVEQARDVDAALKLLQHRTYDCFFIELSLLRSRENRDDAKASRREALKRFRSMKPSLDIIVMTPPDFLRDAVMAVKEGASNYITMPVDSEEVKLVLAGVQEERMLQSELDYLRDRLWLDNTRGVVNTESEAMRSVFKKIRSSAPTKTTILLTGETGTGKSFLAKLIHQCSNRGKSPFIGVHCGAIPEALIESELFGHEKGSFTGAYKRKLGKFEIASGGTMFLDEIGTITPTVQIKLLTALQDGVIHRVGGEDAIQTDVRVIAATNADLKAMCEEGGFRRDLYYRLNVFPIDIPPLRERRDDIPLFAETFLKKMNQFNQKEIFDIQPTVMDALMAYPWPGNIRELENLVERAYILETSNVLTLESFPTEIFDSNPAAAEAPIRFSLPLAEHRRLAVEEIERRYLKEILARNRGKINLSASAAGVGARQLHKLMKKYGIRKEDFKFLQ